MVLNKWKSRRAAVKDLRSRDEELRIEYKRLSALERQLNGTPQYEQVANEIQITNKVGDEIDIAARATEIRNQQLSTPKRTNADMGRRTMGLVR